jgi:signal transduction histidine kinase
VTLTLTYLDDTVLLDVRDDGVGFDPEFVGEQAAGRLAAGFGLDGMRERLREYGGTLTIESAPGAWTTIAAALPRVAADAEQDRSREEAGQRARSGAR